MEDESAFRFLDPFKMIKPKTNSANVDEAKLREVKALSACKPYLLSGAAIFLYAMKEYDTIADAYKDARSFVNRLQIDVTGEE